MLTPIPLPNTALCVSRLGLGTVKFGRNSQVKYPSAFSLPSDQAIRELLSKAHDLGINLLDTAPAYGVSEERLGKMIRDQRHQWVISTKVGEEFTHETSHFDYSSIHVVKSIDRSLKRLHTDYLDIVLVHSNGEDKKIIEQFEIFETLSQLKKAGKIRAFGMSTKTIEGGLLTVDHADVVMVTYNLIETNEQPVIAYAYTKNKSVFIKKSFASGHLQQLAEDDPIQKSMDFIFKEPGVTSIILGTINPLHLAYNVKCAENYLYNSC